MDSRATDSGDNLIDNYYLDRMQDALLHGFSLEELKRWCFSSAHFHDWYVCYGEGITQAVSFVDLFLGFALKQMTLDIIITECIYKHNPSRYEKHGPFRKSDIQAGKINFAISTQKMSKILRGAGADLSEIDLSSCNLSRANFSNTDLSQANLSNADLSKANLTGAKLPSNFGRSRKEKKQVNI